jgi:predicted RNase H-like HicB family nuclease
MRDERFEVSVTFDAERGYVASAPELCQPVVA